MTIVYKKNSGKMEMGRGTKEANFFVISK